MNTWLMKSEPDVYSWQDLIDEGTGVWDGVRNYQARNNLQAMQVGDKVIFYHSNGARAAVGVARITKAAFPDPTFTPEKGKPNPWVVVELVAEKPFKKEIPLATIKQHPDLQNCALVRQSRLSVMPITKAEWAIFEKLGG